MVISSIMEGGAHVVSEAIALGIPVSNVSKRLGHASGADEGDLAGAPAALRLHAARESEGLPALEGDKRPYPPPNMTEKPGAADQKEGSNP